MQMTNRASSKMPSVRSQFTFPTTPSLPLTIVLVAALQVTTNFTWKLIERFHDQSNNSIIINMTQKIKSLHGNWKEKHLFEQCEVARTTIKKMRKK